jgi:3-hydroxyisobutyrate dehydrogenase-like beta-hydroxyacid dehydrogenase
MARVAVVGLGAMGSPDLRRRRAARAHLRLATAAREWLADTERSGRGADDYSAVLAEIVSRAPRG